MSSIHSGDEISSSHFEYCKWLVGRYCAAMLPHIMTGTSEQKQTKSGCLSGLLTLY